MSMSGVDPAGEWRELSERYRQMTDEELVVLARQHSELTEVAGQALTQEISYRKLAVPPAERPVPPPAETEPDSAYAEDRKLVEIRTVWSVADAFQIQALLERAGIPFFMGPEKASGADAVTSDFAKGVSVQIMQVGVPWANQALLHYTPLNEPESDAKEGMEESPAVQCPKCHSMEVVLGELVADSPSNQFEWSCDSCGYAWQDDGVVGEH